MTEVLVVLAISAMIVTPLYAVLQGAFRNERSQSEQLEAEAQLERVAARIEDDIRAGIPSQRRAGSPESELAILSATAVAPEEIILWSVSGGELRRRSIDVDTGTLLTDLVLLEDLSDDAPIFSYWETSGTEIKPTAVGRVADCAVRVTVDLRVVADSVDAGRVVDVAHRTPNPEASSC